ncbi:MAG: hypothetical protein COB14_01535 [Alphaproteobacteria bacterium]|nr:MAG: hypothetical protein COB14_01535 [Alphaproteobacteria bacterium]
MSDNSKTITEDSVIAFLSENPNFLKDNPQVCDLLLPPATVQGKGLADFQSYMIERLKADKEEVIESTREIVENARSNMNNQQRIHMGVLRVLEATHFDEFIHCITMDLAATLNVDISVLVIEASGTDIPHIHQNGIRILPEGTINEWMNGKTILLQDDISGIEAIYGGGATLVRSQILLRVDISMDTPPAILAFGSRDPNMFHEGQATDQIIFLARVIERCFRSWLDIAA